MPRTQQTNEDVHEPPPFTIGTPVRVPEKTLNSLLNEPDQFYSYDAYGNIISELDDAPKPAYQKQFTGHFYHRETGLYLAPYRAYDPELGRWLSREPLGLDGPNLYHYVFADPISYFDPDGLSKVKFAAKTAKGAWKFISRNHAKKKLNKKGPYNPDKDVYYDGSPKQGRKLSKEAFGKNKTKHHGHPDGCKVDHFQHKNGGRGHIIKLPGATLGTDIFGDNIIGDAVDLFNPIGDLQDVLDIYDDPADWWENL